MAGHTPLQPLCRLCRRHGSGDAAAKLNGRITSRSKSAGRLLAWTEQSLWQNSYYVEVEQLAGCRVEDWYNMLKELDIKGEKIDEAQAKSILRICEAIYYARRSLKIDRLRKTVWKDIKELYQRIQVLVYDVYSSKCLLNCIKGNNSRALYRDSGLLIGWRLQSMQSANTKALKAYDKVLEALKK